jgi:hypothetical protein
MKTGLFRKVHVWIQKNKLIYSFYRTIKLHIRDKKKLYGTIITFLSILIGAVRYEVFMYQQEDFNLTEKKRWESKEASYIKAIESVKLINSEYQKENKLLKHKEIVYQSQIEDLKVRHNKYLNDLKLSHFKEINGYKIRINSLTEDVKRLTQQNSGYVMMTFGLFGKTVGELDCETIKDIQNILKNGELIINDSINE